MAILAFPSCLQMSWHFSCYPKINKVGVIGSKTKQQNTVLRAFLKFVKYCEDVLKIQQKTVNFKQLLAFVSNFFANLQPIAIERDLFWRQLKTNLANTKHNSKLWNAAKIYQTNNKKQSISFTFWLFYWTSLPFHN